MKTMRTLKNLFFGLLVMVAIVSCEKEETVVLDAVGDAYIITKVVDGETLYAPVFYVRGSNTLEEVIAYKGAEKANSYELKRYYSYDGEAFKYIPGDDDFTADLPETGAYTFDIIDINGKTLTVTDELTDDVLPELEIEEVYQIEQEVYRIEWEEVEGAYNYMVNIYDENDELAFQSDYLSGYYTEFILSKYKYRWLMIPEEGDFCRVEVWAISYEGGLARELHKQCVSAGSAEFDWGI